MDIRKIKKLIELLEEAGISEIEIREGEESIRISKQHAPVSTLIQTHTQPAIPSDTIAHSQSNPITTTHHSAPQISGQIIKAPMVGTFYRCPGPDSSPFVEIGQSIQTGKTVCIIEAMKTLNQIESEYTGIIKQILVDNGQPVEFGQPLFIISTE